jgi:hypothetical protein
LDNIFPVFDEFIATVVEEPEEPKSWSVFLKFSCISIKDQTAFWDAMGYPLDYAGQTKENSFSVNVTLDVIR